MVQTKPRAALVHLDVLVNGERSGVATLSVSFSRWLCFGFLISDACGWVKCIQIAMPCPSDRVVGFFPPALRGGAGHKHHARYVTGHNSGGLEKGQTPVGSRWECLNVSTSLMSHTSMICWWSFAKPDICAAATVALFTRLMDLLRTTLLMPSEIKIFQASSGD